MHGPVPHRDLNRGTGAFDEWIDLYLHPIPGEGVQGGIGDAVGIELIEPTLPVVQHHGRHVGGAEERSELGVPPQRAVHSEDDVGEAHLDRSDVPRVQVVVAGEGHGSGDQGLQGAGSRPQPQGDVHQLPLRAQPVGDEVGVPPVGVGVVDPAVGVGEDRRGGAKPLCGQHPRQ